MRRAPMPPTACSRGGRDRRANPRRRRRTAHGSHPGTTREHEPERYGGHAHHTQSDANGSRFVACPGKAEARTEVGQPPAQLCPPATPPRGAAHSPPPPRRAIPPSAGSARRPGLPNDPGRTSIHGGDEPAKKGGPGRGPRAAPPGEGAGEPRRDSPSPVPPLLTCGLRATGTLTFHPPQSRGGVPPSPGRTAAPEGRTQ